MIPQIERVTRAGQYTLSQAGCLTFMMTRISESQVLRGLAYRKYQWSS